MQRKTVWLATKLDVIKGAVAVGALLLVLPAARAQFPSLPAYEPFGEFAEGEHLGTNGDSGIFWDVGNGGTNGVGSFVITAAAAMSFPALVADTNTTPKGIESVYENTTSADRGFLFPTNVGTIYGSFLLNYIDNGASTITPTNHPVFNLATGGTDVTNGSSFGAIYSSVWLTADYRLQINKNFQQNGTNTSSSAVLATNVPHLIVVRYLVHAGGNDEFDLWTDPMPFGNDGSIPPPTLSTTNGPNITNFNALMINWRKLFGYYDAAAFYEDEIRVGTDWATVTPLASPAPGPYFAVTGGGATCPGSPPHVGLSGSVSTNIYLLYSNNVYTGTAMTGTGLALDYGTQSTPGVYMVLASNTTTANIGWMSNSVTVAVIQPPSIVTEPNPVVTTTNNRAEFVVAVTGGGLGYQWYQNGTALADGGSVTGSATSDLVISPATPTNTGNYYCVITNSCGLISYTTTNSLTLDSPNNLLWSGDAFNLNVWAVGPTTVPEFTDTNNNTTNFNAGDNVTFNDTYAYTNSVTLIGILTPSMIVLNDTRNYTFAGSGYIAGSGSLVMNNSGVLTLTNDASSYANTYTGGTVISNGTVNMHNSWTGLGTGPLTLAGGTLETFQKGSGTGVSPTTSGFLTNILVTASSTWQVDRTGNQCAGSVGALLGSPGTTLTITNSATNNNSMNEIRFGGVFTNNSALVTAENSVTTGSSMQIGSFNPSGVEVYNGAISGPTCAFIVSGAGTVYLNGANTYTNVTTVSAGLLAGSGSISGPLSVAAAGTIGGGGQGGIGTFSVTGNVTNAGKVFIRVNKSLAQSNDLISATGVITNTGTGTVTVTNIGATPLATGDRFQIFNSAVGHGATMTVTGAGATWANNLAVDGSVQVALNYLVLTNSPKITNFSLAGGNAVISGTNGQAGATAFLLTTTNITNHLSQWRTVGTNILGGTAFAFTATNAAGTGPQQFFRLSSTNYNP